MDMHFVCDGNYKLIWYLRTGKIEFYNLKSDPYETVNLFGNLQYSDLIKDFINFLADKMAERGTMIRRKSSSQRILIKIVAMNCLNHGCLFVQ